MSRTITTILVAALGLSCAVTASAQESPAALMLELERTLPRKMPTPGEQPTLPTPDEWDAILEKVGTLLARSEGTYVEPHAMFQMANVLFSTGRLDESRAMLLDLKSRFASHPLVVAKLEPESASLVDQAISDCEEELIFRKKHKIVDLPRPVLGKTTATLHLNVGRVKLRFYENVAPGHRDNFLQLAKSGFYDLTRIHQTLPGVSASMGDPNSKSLNATEWGKGGPGHDQPLEFSLVQHRKGVVTAWRQPGHPRSHGSQFQILLTNQPHLDYLQVPFAQVEEGLDVLDGVSRQTRNQYQAPAEEVILTGITIEQG